MKKLGGQRSGCTTKKLMPILGDLLYSFLGSPILVFLEHVLEVAALHVDARSDQQVLRHPPHLGRGQAALCPFAVCTGIF